MLVDESGLILSTNQHALNLFGYSASELNGQLVESLMPARFRMQHITYRLLFTDQLGMRAHRPLVAQRKDGSELTVAISLSSVQRGLRTFVVVGLRI